MTASRSFNTLLNVSYMLYLFVFTLLIALMGYIRFSNQDIAKFHVTSEIEQDEILKGGVKRRVRIAIEDLHQVILAEPRTKLVAGAVEDGMATYVTRSWFWGFPDYTTVKSNAGDLEIYARLVFGRSDFGVNAARVDRWVRALTTD